MRLSTRANGISVVGIDVFSVSDDTNRQKSQSDNGQQRNLKGLIYKSTYNIPCSPLFKVDYALALLAVSINVQPTQSYPIPTMLGEQQDHGIHPAAPFSPFSRLPTAINKRAGFRIRRKCSVIARQSQHYARLAADITWG